MSKIYVKVLCVRSRIYLHAANRENVLLEAIQPDKLNWLDLGLSHRHHVVSGHNRLLSDQIPDALGWTELVDSACAYCSDRW